MSVSIESPHASLVFSSFNLDSLSPPPTPAAKRVRRFIPRGNVETSPTPMFFPKSQSLLGSYSGDNKQGASDESRNQLANQLSSRPIPTLQLQRRLVRHPMNEKESTLLVEKDLNRIPPLPFSFEQIPTVPSLSSSKSSEMSMSSSSKNASSSDCSSSRGPPRQTTSPEISAGPELVQKKVQPQQMPQGKPAPPSGIASKTTIATASGRVQQVKLPSFQRGGMHSRTVNRRNSLVAKSA